MRTAGKNAGVCRAVPTRESDGDTGKAGTALPFGAAARPPVKKGQDAQLDKIDSAVHVRGSGGTRPGKGSMFWVLGNACQRKHCLNMLVQLCPSLLT